MFVCTGPYRGKCSGCLSMVCIPCLKSQNEALFQIEQLLARLETAEALYPSSKSFGQHYPLYNSEQFVARVKAMCLWYNMTKHLRIKLLILGKFLMFLKNKDYVGSVNDFGTTSTSRECPEKSSSTDSNNTQHSEKLSRYVSLLLIYSNKCVGTYCYSSNVTNHPNRSFF